MARRLVALSLGFLAVGLSTSASAQPAPPNPTVTVTLRSEVVGNTAFSYLEAEREAFGQQDRQALPPHHIYGCAYWSDWHLYRVNAVSRDRTYGVYIYDGCNNDAQVFPVPTDIRQGSCNNDDQLYPSGKYSVCPIIEEGHVPAGMPFDRRCMALTEADTALFADVSPETYDASQPTALTLTTSFASDITQRLAEGSCADVLSWQAVAWTVKWSDGTVDRLPASGQGGITTTHTVAPSPQGGQQEADVTVIARLHIRGQALDFDDAGDPVVRAVDGYVDISNRDGATGVGAAPVDVPPKLTAGAIAAGQEGDGGMGKPAADAQPSTHAVTMRGRLLALYPRAIVVRPGVEMIDGVEVGRATTEVVGWRYEGPATDAPPNEGTEPGDEGSRAEPIVVQYDHAERLDALGRPIDEQVPLAITVRTTYPDGNVVQTEIAGSIGVAIFYAGLTE